jgi:hypothetical protein
LNIFIKENYLIKINIYATEKFDIKFSCFASAEVGFQNLKTGEVTGLNQSCLSFGKDSRLTCTTGGFHPIFETRFLFHFSCYYFCDWPVMNEWRAGLGQIQLNLGSYIIEVQIEFRWACFVNSKIPVGFVLNLQNPLVNSQILPFLAAFHGCVDLICVHHYHSYIFLTGCSTLLGRSMEDECGKFSGWLLECTT